MNFTEHDDDEPGPESPTFDSTHKDECADGIGDDDRDMMFTSSDTDSIDEPLSNHCFDDWQTDGGDAVVECLPDYIVYRDKYSTDSVVTFSSSCIKIEGYWKAETFEFQWGVDHIMNIECQWCERLELATVIIRVNSKGIAPTEDVHGHTGFEEFKFAIVEDWYRKQDEIMSLDVYQPLWNIVLSSDMERDAKVLPGQSKIFPLKHYFPSFEDSFEDVIYPKGDPDAVSISKRDVDRLEPEIFVNDTIIDFYIKYLKNKIDPSERHRFHFFNSFFYPKLAELGKSLSSFVEGRAAFRSVRRWTRKISLFEKDYIFVPVNFNYHWSLIVICHPGEVADFQDSDARKSLKLPCILHMDSIRGSHSGLKGLIQSYLWEEWKERHADSSEDIFLKFSNMRFFSLELPQQQNLYDCGLFLLHYVELFLEGNLVNFNPLKISSFSNFLTANWFQPAEASLKRAYIQRLIYDMLDDGSSEPSPSNGEDEKCTSMYLKSVDKDRTTSEFLWDGSSFSKVVHESVPCSEDGQRLELGLLHSSLADSIQSANVSGFILRGPGEAEAAVESLCGAFERTRAEAAVESFCQDFEKTKAEGGVESFCQAYKKTTPSEAETAGESFCQAFEQTAPSDAEAAVESFCQASEKIAASKAEAAVKSFCQNFERSAPSEVFENSSKSIHFANDSGFVSRGRAEAEAAVESFCQPLERTAPAEEFKNTSESIQIFNDSGFVSRGPAEAETAVESFCQAFDQTAPPEEFKNGSESIQPVNDFGFVSRGTAKAEAAVESCCQDFEQNGHSECSNAMPPIEMGFVSRRPAEAEAAVESLGQGFEQTAPSEESRNVSQIIQPVNCSSFVSRGLAEAESFCQAFEQTAPSEEFRNVSESMQPVNGSSFVPRGLAKEEVAVESLSQDVEPPSGCSNAMPPLEQEDKSYKHSCCPSLGTTGFQEPKTSTSEACVAYLSKESGAEPLWNRESNMCQNVLMDTDSSKESICASDDLLKSKNAIHSKIGTNLSMEVKLDHHQPKFSSLGNLELFVDLRVPSSSDHMLNRNNTFSKNCGTPPRNCDALEDRSAACAPVQCICDGSGTGVQQATKKRRLAPIKEGPSLDEDLHE
ncbi:probable ubiquitin-like-specific protease 2B isoform X2 [Daucus carota subsp. sativus]|uniref:probable ubiquitin-like-specific protease 2B isoform X2 n=1 Tax=Daucus carota subsp. sativus TaxID=79200 RepID=UPI0007EF7067|nr:PREDICTED: probable ubiquitin-like-specific protease 2B isoform X2 [Daucus carota subsp. sativus]